MVNPADPADPGQKKRNLMTEVLDISISNARCQSHMKAALTPPDTEEKIVKVRAALKAAKEAAKEAGRPASEDQSVCDLKQELEAATGSVVRIGGDSPIAIAAACDWIVRSTMTHAMDNTREADHKMVEISALHAGDPTSLDVWHLISELPSIKSYDPETESTLKSQRAAENKSQKEHREAAKKAREAGETSLEKTIPSDDEDDHDGPTTTFHTYVDAATKAVKQKPEYATMRVANRLREVLSQVVAEFVERYSKVAKVVILEVLCVRTLNANHLKAIIKSVYVAKTGVENDAGMVAIIEYMTEKVELYHAHLEAEKLRKWEEMDPAKKSEIEAKRASSEGEKVKAAAITAKTKAVEMAHKAKSLAAEVKKL